QAGNNFGNLATLTVRRGTLLGANARRAFASFDFDVADARFVRLVAATVRFHLSAVTAGRTIHCHEVIGAAWTEGGLTWNNQPGVGDIINSVTTAAGQTEHEFNLDLDDLFLDPDAPDGTLRVRLRDSEDPAGTDNLDQVYHSREAAGQADRSELELQWEAQDQEDLASTVTVRRSGNAALAATLTVPFTSARFGQFKRVALLAAGGGATAPNGVAYDAVRDALWVVDQTNKKVRRYAAHSLELEQEYDPPAGTEPVGCAFDGEFLWLSDDIFGTIKKFSIGATTLTEEASYDHDFRTVLAWDGSTIWSADTIGQEVYRHNLDATLSVAETFTGLPEVWGLAFPTDGDDPYLLENLNPFTPDFRFRKRRVTDLALRESFEYLGDHGARPFGLAFVPGFEAGKAVTVEETAGDALVWVHGDLPTTVQPANIRRTADLASTAQPRNIPGTEDLDATVQPANIPRTADLASTARPGNIPRTADLDTIVQPANISDTADLAAQVQPANIPGVEDLATVLVVNVPGQAHLPSSVLPRFSGVADLASTVAPTLFEVASRGRVTGVVGAPFVVDARDFRDISAEVGSTIEWTRAGSTRTLRRVVQLVDTQDAKTFPRERTSELGRSSTQDQLRRGDAILFATDEDDF
ncbi:MAG TPA: hypothetical protein VGA36_08125, partial [Nitriliruptorales bacterium]